MLLGSSYSQPDAACNAGLSHRLACCQEQPKQMRLRRNRGQARLPQTHICMLTIGPLLANRLDFLTLVWPPKRVRVR
jgi:hypothetical protein